MISDALGTRIGILPYTLSGLPLARALANQYDKNPEIEAVVIVNHGIFTFGEDAVTSYERMIEYVSRAEAFIKPKIHSKTLATPRSDAAIPKNIGHLAAAFAQIVRGGLCLPDRSGRIAQIQG